MKLSLFKGSWSDFESIVLSEIVAKEHSSISDIVKLYKETCDYSLGSDCILELPSNVVFSRKLSVKYNVNLSMNFPM